MREHTLFKSVNLKNFSLLSNSIWDILSRFIFRMIKLVFTDARLIPLCDQHISHITHSHWLGRGFTILPCTTKKGMQCHINTFVENSAIILTSKYMPEHLLHRFIWTAWPHICRCKILIQEYMQRLWVSACELATAVIYQPNSYLY